MIRPHPKLRATLSSSRALGDGGVMYLKCSLMALHQSATPTTKSSIGVLSPRLTKTLLKRITSQGFFSASTCYWLSSCQELTHLLQI